MKKRSPHQKQQDKIEDTKAHKKMWHYIESLVGTKKFEKDIADFRDKYSIPQNGYEKVIYTKIKGKKYISTPKELDNTDFREDILSISNKHGLDIVWASAIEQYAIYNNLDIHVIGDVFEVVDLKFYLSGPEEMEYEGERWTDNSKQEYLEEVSKTHPVAILLHPYATQNDIVDYIKKIYNVSIKPLLTDNKNSDIKLGKIRKKNHRVKVRNKYIYDNRGLNIKELTSLVATHFGDILEYPYIEKIIKDEGKKRSVLR